MTAETALAAPNGYACASSARDGSGASWAQQIAGGVTALPLPAAVPAGSGPRSEGPFDLFWRGAQLRVLQQQGTPVRVSSAVVGQVWRDGRKQANLARVLAGVGLEALGTDDGKRVGELLALSGSADIVDAHVALLTAHADLVLTGDPGDIRKLLHARRVSARVQTV